MFLSLSGYVCVVDQMSLETFRIFRTKEKKTPNWHGLAVTVECSQTNGSVFSLCSFPCRRTGPREGEIQIDCRRNGHHFRRIGWLLKNTNHAKEKEKHQRFFINYIPAHLPSDVLFSYTQQEQLKNTTRTLSSHTHVHQLHTPTQSRHETHFCSNRLAQCIFSDSLLLPRHISSSLPLLYNLYWF